MAQILMEILMESNYGQESNSNDFTTSQIWLLEICVRDRIRSDPQKTPVLVSATEVIVWFS